MNCSGVPRTPRPSQDERPSEPLRNRPQGRQAKRSRARDGASGSAQRACGARHASARKPPRRRGTPMPKRRRRERAGNRARPQQPWQPHRPPPSAPARHRTQTRPKARWRRAFGKPCPPRSARPPWASGPTDARRARSGRPPPVRTSSVDAPTESASAPFEARPPREEPMRRGFRRLRALGRGLLAIPAPLPGSRLAFSSWGLVRTLSIRNRSQSLVRTPARRAVGTRPIARHPGRSLRGRPALRGRRLIAPAARRAARALLRLRCRSGRGPGRRRAVFRGALCRRALDALRILGRRIRTRVLGRSGRRLVLGSSTVTELPSFVTTTLSNSSSSF